jgi:hypothetical protein
VTEILIFAVGGWHVILVVSELGALIVAASPPRALGSANRVLYESPSGKTISAESQHYFGFRVNVTSHADVMPSTMDYLRLPDVSPPSVGPNLLRDDIYSPQNSNPVASDAAKRVPASVSSGSPAASKKKMGMSSMFRMQSK